MSEVEELVRARNEVDQLRRRWTEASVELQEVTTLLHAAIKRSTEILARTEGTDAARRRRGELDQSAQTVRASTSPWFTVAEAADRARCSRNTVLLALHAEQLKKGSGLLGRQRTEPKGYWLIHIDDLDDWICGRSSKERRK